MSFVWCDYNPQAMEYVESWLDPDAISSTGLDQGFRAFFEYWVNEEGYNAGENFWCKVIFENDDPLAVLAFCQDKDRLIIMEFIVSPEKRGQGIGTRLLKDLLENKGIIDSSFSRCEAVIYPSNIASQKAFENAGFHYLRTHEDGGSMLYTHP